MMSAGEPPAVAAPAPSVPTSDIGGMAMGNGIASVGTTIFNVASAWIASSYQSSILDIQAKMQEEGFKFQVDSSEIAKEMKIDLIGAELEKQGIQREGQKLLNASIQNRAKVEGDLAAEKAIKKDAETTKKFAETKTNKGAIARMFSDMRSEPFYGRPVGF